MPLYRSRAPVINLDEGLSAIGKAFSLPSGAETYAYARARKVQQELANQQAGISAIRGGSGAIADFISAGVSDPVKASSIADMYRRSVVPGARPQDLDTSSYALHGNAGNTFAGLDISNRAKMAQTQVEQRGQLDRALVAPVGQGQTRFLPPTIAGAYDLPATQTGVVELNQGQQATLPDGRVLAGAPKPLSTDELAAQDALRLPLDDPMRRALGLRGVQTLNVQTPEGPRIATIPQAIGQAPAVDNSGKVTNYTGPNGAKGTAAPGANGKLVDTQTGAEVPAGSTVYSGQAQGTPDQFGKTTEAQDRYGLALKMTDDPTRIINDAFASNKLPSGGDDAIRALSNLAPGAVGTFISQQMSPEAQSFHNAIKNAVPYQLLALSGQGVTEAEYERTMARLIPFANDTPEVKAQKRNQFNAFREGIRGLAGPAAAKVGVADAPAPAAAAPAVPADTTAAAEAWVRGPDGKLKRAQ